MKKPYCFVGSFKLVVYAKSKAAAFRHLKSAWSCRAYRTLKFAGSFEPRDPEGWVASINWE